MSSEFSDGFETRYAIWDAEQNNATFWASSIFHGELTDPEDHRTFGERVDELIRSADWLVNIIGWMLLVEMFTQYNEIYETINYPTIDINGAFLMFKGDFRKLVSVYTPEEPEIRQNEVRVREIYQPFHHPFETAFRSEYLDPHGTVDFYARLLSNYAENWNLQGNETWDGPYTSMTSSSSTGKTRLLKEIALKHIPTIYMCLRGDDEEGYPKGNLPSFAYDCVNPGTDGLWEHTFVSMVTGIITAVNCFPQGTAEDQRSRKSSYLMVRSRRG